MSSPPDHLSAALSDRYRIERELGQGGMATVYLAADLKHDRKVAIKVLKPELAAVLGAERFVVEIRAAHRPRDSGACRPVGRVGARYRFAHPEQADQRIFRREVWWVDGRRS